MSSVFCLIDDKHVPLYRVLWLSDLPHFCGHDDCLYEGRYEVRLEMDESVWANHEERDDLLTALEAWAGGSFCLIDDKHVPLYRVLWLSDLPHFCGHDDCLYEGRYEIRLEMDESVWANREEREALLAALESWAGDSGPGGGGGESDDGWR